MEPSLNQRWTKLQAAIDLALEGSGRSRQSLRLIGVTKKQALKPIEQVLEWGLQDLGENYVQEWQQKRIALADVKTPIFWHFIGHLQSNKVKDVVGRVDYIHTVDSLKLAQKIAGRAGDLGLTQKVLLEINVAGEPQKSGFLTDALEEILPTLAALPHLQWEGFMCIPPQAENAESSRPYFKKMKSLLDEWNRSGVFKSPLKELSMGMSQDFTVAIEEGATMIRVGTSLFGPRN